MSYKTKIKITNVNNSENSTNTSVAELGISEYNHDGNDSQSKFDITLSDSYNEKTDVFSVVSNGNVGIGVTEPEKKLEVSGDVKIDGEIDINNHKIINIAPPTNNQDVATKSYVDTSVNIGITDVGSGCIITTAERTKLTGIEEYATADQTGIEIKTLYENNSNTNCLTDSLHTKLNLLDASATATNTANVSSAGAVMITDDQNISGTKTFTSIINGDINGNSHTATTLANSKNINGIPFNGSADIELPLGKVLQMIHVEDKSAVVKSHPHPSHTPTNHFFNYDLLNLTLIPKSTSSTMLITVHIGKIAATPFAALGFSVVRVQGNNETKLVGTNIGNRIGLTSSMSRQGQDANHAEGVSFTVRDIIGNENPTTYKVYYHIETVNIQTHFVYINRAINDSNDQNPLNGRALSNITVVEYEN